MSKSKRIRNQNYNIEDTLKLVEMVTDYRNVLENKKTNPITSNQIVRAWESIARLFNAQTITYRNAEQLRQKYDSIKKEARKYAAKKKQYRLQTGGGPADTVKTNKLFEKVLEMIKLSAEGYDSIYDSDATFMASELNSGFVLEEISVDEPIEVTLESASEAVTAINVANVHDDTGPGVG